ncbi:NPC intracellular cholesterol transporter 2 homolog a [Drosophila rhopaloa]|uniref:Protein NPC2 homolog n=1 Tax=Drosophila rhopaloa TaxID=1041015 RepID=A0A6P4FXZ6_DRORH|nr:NPC intracellular cholesterol transporter 2 homolog a [Drosophila rhopaloa]
MLQIVVTLALIVASVSATNVQQCKNKPFPLEVRIKDCDEPPCVVYKGSIAVMEVQFLGNNNNIRSITATTTAKVFGMNLPYVLPDEVSNVCQNLLYGAMCPIDKDEDVTYEFNFYVDPSFPEITADVTVTLNDAQNEPITCFVVSCRIRKGATASQRDEYLLDWTNPISE